MDPQRGRRRWRMKVENGGMLFADITTAAYGLFVEKFVPLHRKTRKHTMKILVTGSDGQLGREIRNALAFRNQETDAVFATRGMLDLTDREAVECYLRGEDFTHIINCAAYTAVEKAEEEMLECAAVNVDAVANLARMAAGLDIKMLHVSTDYIFDGTSNRPYKETDKVNPLSVYGNTKRKGETVLLGLAPGSIIIRTGWLYSPYGHNFVRTMLRLGRERQAINVVCDQIGTPTCAADLASAILDIVFAPQWMEGIYNYSNEGVASWYDFAVATLGLAGLSDVRVNPVPSSDYPSSVVRPMYSVLDKSKIKATFELSIPYWRDSLARTVGRILREENLN